jgi:hypothetical protein
VKCGCGLVKVMWHETLVCPATVGDYEAWKKAHPLSWRDRLRIYLRGAASTFDSTGGRSRHKRHATMEAFNNTMAEEVKRFGEEQRRNG